MNRKTLILSIVGGSVVALFLLPFVLGGLFNYITDFTSPKQTNQISAKISFWNLYDDESLYEGIIQQFRVTQPKIQITYKKYTDSKLLEEDLINALAEGSGPDIISIEPSWIIKHKNKLTPLPTGNQYTDMQYISDNYVDGVLGMISQMTTTVDDTKGSTKDSTKVYALPVSIEPLSIVYNKALLKKGTSKNTPGATWNEFIEDALRMTKVSSDGAKMFYSGFAFGDIALNSGLHSLFALMAQKGVAFYDETKTFVTLDLAQASDSGASLPAQEALSEFLSFSKIQGDHISWSRDMLMEDTSKDELDLFVEGKIAMIPATPHTYSMLQSKIKESKEKGGAALDSNDVSIAPFPQSQKDIDQGSEKSFALLYPLAITKISKNKSAAWAFMTFLQTKPVQDYLFKKGQKISPQLTLLLSQQKDKKYGAFAEDALRSVFVMLPQEQAFTEFVETIILNQQKTGMDDVTLIKMMKEKWQCYVQKDQGKEFEKDSICIEK